MIVLGITGGIGSGKTTVCQLLELMGIPVFYADAEARHIVDNDEIVRKSIESLFGNDVYINQRLNRKVVADKVFKNKQLLANLNAIVHPAVANRFLQWSVKYSNLPIVAKEAAILFESGAYKSVHKTILVLAPVELRISRVMKRDGLTRQQVSERLNNQWTDEQKMALADFVVHCDEKQLAIPQIINILQQIKN
jgi:dephospho-CoA kinase